MWEDVAVHSVQLRLQVSFLNHSSSYGRAKL